MFCHLIEKSGKTRNIENCNFYFTETIVLSFDRKSGKIRQIHEFENDNFMSRKKMMFCHLTENPENLGKFIKLKTFISRKKY